MTPRRVQKMQQENVRQNNVMKHAEWNYNIVGIDNFFA
jgi:hypothetical protein